jgi:uncharacterized protein (TIGR03437 family)
MTIRLLIATCALVSVVGAQKLPGFQWVQEVDGSGTDSLAGLATDAMGNIYIAGSTLSPKFPVKAAVQGVPASSGLYRINGVTSTALGLISASAIAVDPQNPNTIFAVSQGALVKSTNGGIAFSPTSLLTSHAFSISFQPGNDQILFAATIDQGVQKSADGGATWTPMNIGIPAQAGNQITVQNLWIDPVNPALILAATQTGLARSSDGGSTWMQTSIVDDVLNVTFSTTDPNILYVGTVHAGVMQSTDGGQTFSPSFSTPTGVYEVLPDPIQSGRLIGAGDEGIYQSTDGGAAWTQESATGVEPDLVADPINGVYYVAAGSDSSVVRIPANLQTMTPAGPARTASLTALSVVNGQLYAANQGSAHVFVTKLDPSGNILYSTYFGGSANDQAIAIAVDPASGVYVTGATNSLDFPVSKGAYASSGNVFLFKLNSDGSLGYSTYFSGTFPAALAVDAIGSAWLAGTTEGGLPVTPGALATEFCCPQSPYSFGIGPEVITNEASATRFNASGSGLIFSTYVAGSSVTSVFGTQSASTAIAVAADETACVGGGAGIFRIDSTGSSLLSSMPGPLNPVAMAFGPDGSLYATGIPGDQFPVTADAFQTTPGGKRVIPGQGFSQPQVAIARIDAGLKSVIAATYFSNLEGNQVTAMTLDQAGNVYIAGKTAPQGLPTRTPFQGGFSYPTGFMSELSGDLTTLLFSSYFGDTENFTVAGVGIGSNGSVVIGGATSQSFGTYFSPGNFWLNSLSLTPPPSLRIDSVQNAASLLDVPLSGGETIVVNGAGFGADSQLSIGGAVVAPLTITPTAITATVPANVPSVAAEVQVQSGGVSSNQVLMPTAATSPGLFALNGTGYGQGYILNKDGTLNTTPNPAAPGDPVTIFATGVGPVSFTDCCAVAQYSVNVFIDGFYCDGMLAVMRPVSGLPGNVYQITVYIPTPAALFPSGNPGFAFPASSGVVMQINGVSSQLGIWVSIAQ